MKMKQGDALHLSEAPENYRLTPYNPQFDRQIELGKQIMHDDWQILKALSR
jgi:hypothetical protein